MANWQDNTIMYWNGNKVTDHSRSELNVSYTRLGTDQRTSNGTLRRQDVGLKRTFTVSWENLPSKTSAGAVQTVDGGWNGDQIETFVQSSTGRGAFRMIIRAGSASGKTAPNPADSALPYDDGDFEITRVMITDFSKDVVKRGTLTDLWNVSVTLEEV